MKKKYKCILISPLVLVGFCFVGGLLCLMIWGSMNYTGFCWKETRWLSDHEFVESMISTINRNPDPYGVANELKDKYNSNTYKHIPYNSVNSFLKMNPECCKLDDGPKERIWGGGLASRIMGTNGASATISYNLRYVMSDGTKQTFDVTEYPNATNCGRAYNSDPN